MPNNSWGDAPATTAPVSNDWGDAPATPSPYAEEIARQADFKRRATLNTPASIGARAVIPEIDLRSEVPLQTQFGPVPLSIAQPVLENAPRVGVPLGAAMALTGVGTLPGAAIMAGAGALGELGSQAIEKQVTGSRQDFSLPQIGASGLLTALPPLRLAGVASPLARGALRLGEGAAIGGAYPLVEAGLEGRVPGADDFSRAKSGALAGAALSAPFAAIEAVTPRMVQVSERMAGKPPEQAREILNQEVKLAGDMLTPAEERVALETKQKLDDQIATQKEAEAAQKAQEQQAKAVATQQKQQQQAAAQAAEPPKSAQILAESQKPPSIANVATEIGTQTSPYALQEKLGQLTAPPEQPGITVKPLVESAITPFEGRKPAMDLESEGGFKIPPAPPSSRGDTIAVNSKPLGDGDISHQITRGEEPVGFVDTTLNSDGTRSVTNARIKYNKQGIGSESYIKINNDISKNGERLASGPLGEMSNAARALWKGLVRDGHAVANQGNAAKEHAFEFREESPAGPRDATVSTGDGVPTAKEQAMLKEQQRLVDEHLAKQAEPIELPPLPRVDLHAADFDSLNKWADAVKSYDRKLEEVALGTPERVEQFRKATKKMNSSDNARADEGLKELGEIEKTLTPQQADVLYAKNIPYIDPEDARGFVRTAADIDSSESANELARAVSNQVKKFIQNTKLQKPISEFDQAVISRATEKAKELGLKSDDFLREILRYRMKFDGRDAAELLGMTEDQAVELMRPKPRTALPEPVPVDIESRPTSSEQRLNDAGSDLPPISGMSREAKRAELDAAGVKTYNGKLLDEANPAQISAAVGKLRRGQLEGGNISEKLVAPLAGSGGGAILGYTETDQQPGESDEAYQARRLKNAALGAVGGAAAGVGLNILAIGAQAAGKRRRAALSESVELPTPGENQGIRQTAEKVIENREYPEKLRQTLADDPDILYDKFALGELADRVTAATEPELQSMLASANVRERLGATAELANRYSLSADPAKQAEGARLYSELAQNLTNPAQMLGLGKLVKTPQGFITAINEQLKNVKRTLSKQQENALGVLATKSIKSEQALSAAERKAMDDFSAENEAAYRTAQKASADAKKNLDDFVHQVAPEGWGDITSKIIQGNLMAPMSFVKNVFGNIVYQPAMRGADTVASALDTVFSTVTGRKRTISLLNPLPSTRELQAAADGIVIAGKELLTGPGTDSYIKGEVQRGFKPMRSLVQAFTGENLAVRADGSIAFNDRAKKFIEGTLGIAPEASFRILNLGDKGFRRSGEARILLEQAKLRGLKGRELDRFLEFPDKATQQLVDTEGKSAIFAQDNPLAKKINPILDKGIAEFLGLEKVPAVVEANKVLGRLIVPFRQFPLNFVNTAINFAVPEVGIARAAIEAQKGNRRAALRHIGEATIGMTMLGAGKYLWDNRLISEPADKDAKQRSAQYEQMGPQRINISGLKRLTEGGNPAFQLGDETRDWGAFGIPAASFYVLTSKAAKGRQEAARIGEKPNGKFAYDRLSAIPGMASFAFDQSFLSGTSAFLDALKDWDQFGDQFTQNLFRAVTSIPAPNSLEAFAKTQYKYIPELKGDTLGATLKNVWDYKTLQLPEDSRSQLKRDLWGDPLLRTPENRNPYVYQFLDVTKSQQGKPDAFKQALIDLYQKTESPEVYPTLPTRSLSVDGVTVKLDAKDYDDLQESVGKLRRQFAGQVVANPRFADAGTLPEAKLLALQEAYNEGMKLGRDQFLRQPGIDKKYPELFGAPTSEHVTARDIKARGRLRIQQANQWGDEAVHP